MCVCVYVCMCVCVYVCMCVCVYVCMCVYLCPTRIISATFMLPAHHFCHMHTPHASFMPFHAPETPETPPIRDPTRNNHTRNTRNTENVPIPRPYPKYSYPNHPNHRLGYVHTRLDYPNQISGTQIPESPYPNKGENGQGRTRERAIAFLLCERG